MRTELHIDNVTFLIEKSGVAPHDNLHVSVDGHVVACAYLRPDDSRALRAALDVINYLKRMAEQARKAGK